MDSYSILIYILCQFPGCILTTLSIVHHILVVGGEGPTHPCGLGAKEGGETDSPPPPNSIFDLAIFVFVYAVYAVCGGRGGGNE